MLSWDNCLFIACITRFRITSLGEDGRVSFQEDTGIVHLSLAKDEVRRTSCVCFSVALAIVVHPFDVVALRKQLVCHCSLQECPLLTLSRPAKLPHYIAVNMALTSANTVLPQSGRDD